MGVVVGSAVLPVRLCGLQKRIFDVVNGNHPNVVSTDVIVDMVYAHRLDGGPDWANSTVRRSVYEINRKLKPFGFKLAAKVGRNSPGYRVVEIAESQWDLMWKRPFDRPELVYGES